MEPERTATDDAGWLRERGFQFVGRWRYPDLKLDRLERPPATPAIYAFVVGGCVRYIGKATYLRGRLRGYNRALQPETRRAFRTVHCRLREVWKAGGTTEVWVCHHALADHGPLADHESRLIREKCPEWNVSGVPAHPIALSRCRRGKAHRCGVC